MLIIEKVQSSRNAKLSYIVKLSDDGIFFCSCPDFYYNKKMLGQPCKHLKQVMERLEKGIKIEIPTKKLRLFEAIRWFAKKYSAKIISDYHDLQNLNFLGKQVGSIVEIKGKRFFITVRPRGFTFKIGDEIHTGMNSSELFYEHQYGIDRVVIFVLPSGLKAYRFNINKIWEYMNRNPKVKVEFNSYPQENEPLFNVPMSLAQDFDMWLTIQDTKVAMCSKCKKKGSEDSPLLVFGRDGDRISGCCRAKVLLVKRET